MMPIRQQILHTYNETAVPFAFHPATELEGAVVGGKLPLTIYESVYKSAGGGGDTSMEIDGQEKIARLDLRFRELPYLVKTGEVEAISVDFVAKGWVMLLMLMEPSRLPRKAKRHRKR